MLTRGIDRQLVEDDRNSVLTTVSVSVSWSLREVGTPCSAPPRVNLVTGSRVAAVDSLAFCAKLQL